MKFIPFICLVFLISCGKKEEAKTVTETPKIPETEIYTLETQNFFIDVPKEYDLNKIYFKTENLIFVNTLNDSIKNYFFTNWKNEDALIISFLEDFIMFDSLDYIKIKENPEILNEKYGFKLTNSKFQMDTIIDTKKVTFFTSSNHFMDKELNETIFFIDLNKKLILLSINKKKSENKRKISDLEINIIKSLKEK